MVRRTTIKEYIKGIIISVKNKDWESLLGEMECLFRVIFWKEFFMVRAIFKIHFLNTLIKEITYLDKNTDKEFKSVQNKNMRGNFIKERDLEKESWLFTKIKHLKKCCTYTKELSMMVFLRVVEFTRNLNIRLKFRVFGIWVSWRLFCEYDFDVI